jgi:general secretion pathway protein A
MADRLRGDESLPLASRVTVRMAIERATPQELQDCLRHALQQAGSLRASRRHDLSLHHHQIR